MQKWEYLELSHSYQLDEDAYCWDDDATDMRTVQDRLNELGGDAWELIAIRVTGMLSARYYFKRPITDAFSERKEHGRETRVSLAS